MFFVDFAERHSLRIGTIRPWKSCLKVHHEYFHQKPTLTCAHDNRTGPLLLRSTPVPGIREVECLLLLVSFALRANVFFCFFSWVSGENPPRRVVQRGQIRPNIGEARPHERATALADARVRGVKHIRRQALQLAGARPS